MALVDLGSLILTLTIFITTLVNFSHALANLEPVVLFGLYAVTKVLAIPPEDDILSICRLGHLYEM